MENCEHLHALYPSKVFANNIDIFYHISQVFPVIFYCHFLPFLSIYGRDGSIIYIMRHFYAKYGGWFLEIFSIFESENRMAVYIPITLYYPSKSTNFNNQKLLTYVLVIIYIMPTKII